MHAIQSHDFHKKESGIESSRQADEHPPLYSGVKQYLDILGALIGLGMTTLILLPIAIRIDRPDPVFYCQEHCGSREEPTKIWKFRSIEIHVDPLKYQVGNQIKSRIFKNEHVPNITHFGKFFHGISLDELAQFRNVLLKRTSLIDTQAPMPNKVKNYDSYHLNAKTSLPSIRPLSRRSTLQNFEAIIKINLHNQQHWPITHISL